MCQYPDSCCIRCWRGLHCSAGVLHRGECVHASWGAMVRCCLFMKVTQCLSAGCLRCADDFGIVPTSDARFAAQSRRAVKAVHEVFGKTNMAISLLQTAPVVFRCFVKHIHSGMPVSPRTCSQRTTAAAYKGLRGLPLPALHYQHRQFFIMH